MFICLLIHFTGSHFRIDDQELSDVIATVERDLFAAVQHHKRPWVCTCESNLTDWLTDRVSEYVRVNRANHRIIFYRPLSFHAGQIYNDTLESVKNSFPQYIRELEGVADGAEVEFHKVRYHTIE